jgi:hypothetical protein
MALAERLDPCSRALRRNSVRQTPFLLRNALQRHLLRRNFLRSIRPRFMVIMLWLGVVKAGVHVVVPMFPVTAMNTALPCGLSDAVAVVQ